MTAWCRSRSYRTGSFCPRTAGKARRPAFSPSPTASESATPSSKTPTRSQRLTETRIFTEPRREWRVYAFGWRAGVAIIPTPSTNYFFEPACLMNTLTTIDQLAFAPSLQEEMLEDTTSDHALLEATRNGDQ